MFVLAVDVEELIAAFDISFLIALTASLALNIYIVGLNQIADVDIDRLNKPYLPLASGEYSRRQAQGIVAIAAFVALALALIQPPILTLTIISGFLIGTLYSVPPLRFKEHALWAALSIAFVRGVVTTVGLYLYFRQAHDLAIELSPLVSSAAIFFFGFGLVIALYKDIPDEEGDRRYTVRTFTVRLGARRVFAIGRWLLTAFYLAPITILASRLPQFAAVIFLAAHLLVLLLFWYTSLRIDPQNKRQMSHFYLGLWIIFYVEYLLLMGFQLVSQFAA